MSLLFWALWGLAGAFGYAGPRLLTSLFDPPAGTRRPQKAIFEFILAVSMGPIAGAGIGPWVAIEMSRTSEAECRALAVVVGLLVNPIAPAAVRLLSDFALARLGHPLARRKTP